MLEEELLEEESFGDVLLELESFGDVVLEDELPMLEDESPEPVLLEGISPVP